MMRSCFFAAGLFVTLWGVSLLFIDEVVLNMKEEPNQEEGISAMFTSITPRGQKVFAPPDWAAFSLMSVGSVTMLYAIALPRKQQ